MILRLFRGSAPADRAGEVAAALAGSFMEQARAMPGLNSFASGLRVDGDVTRFVLATTWDAVSDVVRQTHGRLDQPAGVLLDFMVTESTDHLELVSEPVRLIVASPDAVVRVARMKVRAGREEEFYGTVRRRLAEVHPTGNLLAYHLGRRVGDGHEAVAVSVWQSAGALEDHVPLHGGQPLWQAELDPLLERFDVEHFDAVVLGP